MSNFTEKELHEFGDAFILRCFGVMRMRDASIDGEPVSCHLMVDGKSSLVNQETIPVPLIIRENGQSNGKTLSEIMEEFIYADDSGYRGDNCE